MQRERRSVLAGLLLAVLVVGLSGCGRFTDTIAPGDEVETFALYGTRTISQRFVAHHAGLAEIGVLLQAQPGSGAVTLHLREDAEETSDLATVTIVPQASETPTYHTFALPVQDDVNGKSFLLLLEAPQATAETAVLCPYSSRASGELDLWLDDDLSSGGHVSLQLHYDAVFIVKDLARQASTFGLRSLWLLFLSGLFYLLPGGALVVWLLREGDWIERTVVALGMSVAVYALLVYATMTGLRVGRAATYGFLVLCAGLIGLRWWLDGRPVPSLRGAWAGLKADAAPAALAFVFALVLGVRIFVVRDLVAPMWGDGYHHTMISQLLVDNGGLFDSWEPYAPLTTFTYHFGFHANVALYHWLSGEPVIQSVIWIGQMMNALAVLALYPLAIKVSGGNRWAGVGAVLVAGLLSPMPMYYVNWSRYTQLAGQVILPVLMWVTWELLEDRRLGLGKLWLCWIGAAGLAVTHYRILLFFGAFALVLGLLSLWSGRWRSTLSWGGLLASGGIAGFLPWLVHIWGGRILVNLGRTMSNPAANASEYMRQYNALPAVSFFLSASLWLAVLASALVGSWRRKTEVLVVTTWSFVLLVATNPHWLSLPGVGVISNFALFLSAYIPASLLVGSEASWLINCLCRAKLWRLAVPVVLVGSVAVTAALQAVALPDPERYSLVTAADLRAMKWIEENVPERARLLVNGRLAYSDTVAVGTDAGWWIPLFTRRGNTVPPLSHSLEATVQAGAHQDPRHTVTQIVERGVDAPETLALLARDGVTHVYVGEKNGLVGNPGAALLPVSELRASSHYDLVYQRDGVWIWSVSQ